MQIINAAICRKYEVDKCSPQTSKYAQTRVSGGPPTPRVLKQLLFIFSDRNPLFPQKTVFPFFCEIF